MTEVARALAIHGRLHERDGLLLAGNEEPDAERICDGVPVRLPDEEVPRPGRHRIERRPATVPIDHPHDDAVRTARVRRFVLPDRPGDRELRACTPTLRV